jgi:hypothetical protein
MIPRFILISAVLICYSCSHTSNKDETILKVLDEGITKSNRIINRQTLTVYHALEDKLDNPTSHYKATIWYPRAMTIGSLSTEIFDYIDSLKNDLIKKAWNSKKNSVDEGEQAPVKILFNEEGVSKELYKNLETYKEKILHIDPLFYQEFKKFSLVSNAILIEHGKEPGFSKDIFDDLSVRAALAFLTQIQNNVKQFENNVAVFCNQNCTDDAFHIYELPFPLISQSSNYLKCGDRLSITAGIAVFQYLPNLKITINNMEADLDENGFADYKFKTQLRPGNYKIPVKIEYKDQDGNRRWIDRNVEYILFKD